jgi:predicted Rossmann fold nucleotide-binding protein DprA/Smf involved in DNA uptake
MHATLDAGGHVVGILAEALVRAARSADLRRAVLDGTLCLATPYAPGARFSAGNAMGRNKLIYGLADVTLVVASDRDKGGTWGGAEEALAKRYGPVAAWRGDGEGPGNAALVELGAQTVASVDTVFAAAVVPPSSHPSTAQLPLGI